MVAMAAQPIALDLHVFVANARVQVIADGAVAARAGLIINIMREDCRRPLLRMGWRAAHIAGVVLAMLNQAGGAGLVLVQGKVIHAQAMMTGGAAPGGLDAALGARWYGIDGRLRHAAIL